MDIDWLQAISRMGDIFGSPNQQRPSSYVPQAPPTPSSNWDMPLIPTYGGGEYGGPEMTPEMRMAQLYQPQYGMQNRFNSFLDQYPEPGNPSFMRKLGSTIYGFGAGMQGQDPFKSAFSMANAPYLEQVSRWKNQAPHIQSAADNERLSNSQDRMYSNQVMNQEFAGRRADLADQKNREAFQLGQQKIDILQKAEARKQQAADVLAMVRLNPDLEVKIVDGRAYLFDPRPGGSGLTPTAYGGMTKEEELDFQAKAAMQRVQAQQAGANQRNQVTAATSLARDTNNYVPFNRATPNGGMEAVLINPSTGDVKPMPGGPLMRPSSSGTGGGNNYNIFNRPVTSAQMTARARQGVSEHPEWDSYIEWSPSGQFVKTKTPEGSSGVLGFGAKPGGSADVTKKINEYIFGGASSGGGTRAVPGGSNVTPGAAVPGATLKRTVRNRTTGQTKTQSSADGGQTWKDD